MQKEENQETKLQTPVASVVQELVTSKAPEPSSTTPTQEVSTTKASSVLQEVTTSKPESVDEVSDKSSQLIKKAIEFNNKIDEKTILSLKGIRNLGYELTTKEIRSIILGLMNDYDREG